MNNIPSRRDFLKLCALLGVSASTSTLIGCAGSGSGASGTSNRPGSSGSGAGGTTAPDGAVHDVLIIGAGAAGLTAGFLLAQQEWDVMVLEASMRIGGRLKKSADFCDFPLDLGGEWVQTDASVLNELSQRSDADRRAIPYEPMTAAWWDGAELSAYNSLATSWRGESRFESTTCFDFFNDYMTPAVADRVCLGCQVTSIDYSGEQVTVRTASGDEHKAWYVLVTVPLQILKDGDIAFTPALPASKKDALDACRMPDGIKMFLEFSERFYPDVIAFNDPDIQDEERVYYNVALDKGSQQNVLGLFAVGRPAENYTRFSSDDDLLAHVLGELDAMFEGAASRTYIKHLTQDWSKEPFIRGSYLIIDDNDGYLPETLAQSIDDKVFFAGEAYSAQDNWGFAHVAARAAYRAVERIVALG